MGKSAGNGGKDISWIVPIRKVALVAVSMWCKCALRFPTGVQYSVMENIGV